MPFYMIRIKTGLALSSVCGARVTFIHQAAFWWCSTSEKQIPQTLATDQVMQQQAVAGLEEESL